MTSLLIRTIVKPLIHVGYIPRTQWVPETTDSTKPIYLFFFFSYAYIPMIRFTKVRHSKRINILRLK